MLLFEMYGTTVKMALKYISQVSINIRREHRKRTTRDLSIEKKKLEMGEMVKMGEWGSTVISLGIQVGLGYPRQHQVLYTVDAA